MQIQIKFMAFSYDYQKQRKASIEKKPRAMEMLYYYHSQLIAHSALIQFFVPGWCLLLFSV